MDGADANWENVTFQHLDALLVAIIQQAVS